MGRRRAAAGCTLLVAACISAFRAAAEDAEQTLAAAQAARNAGKLEESKRLSREALRLRPGWGLADYNLALTELLAGDNAAARQGFLQAYREDSALDAALLFAGVTSHDLAEYTAAAGYFRRYLAIKPKDPEGHYYFAGTYLALGDYSNAALEYLTQLALTPRRVQIYYDLAECFLTMAGAALTDLPDTEEGRRFRALAVVLNEQAEITMPEEAIHLARIRLREGNVTAAVKLLSHVAASPLDCSVLENYGDALLAAGDVTDALGGYRQAMAKWPHCLEQPPVDSTAASRLVDLRQPVIAFELARLRASNATDPARPCAAAGGWLARASCFAARGDLRAATAALAADAATDPRTIYWTYQIYSELTRRAAARLAEASPESYLLAEMQAEALELDGHIEQAEAQYRKAVDGAGADARPWIAYGRFECKISNFVAALPILTEAVKRDPNNVEAHALIAEAYLRNSAVERALPHFRAVFQARPTSAGIRIDLARTLADTGKAQEAIALLEATPNDPDGRAHYVLGRLYGQLGRTEDMKRAMDVYRRCRDGGCTNSKRLRRTPGSSTQPPF